MATGLRAVKGGKTENDFESQTKRFRGVEYTIRELSVVEYKEMLKAATKEDGTTPFSDLLELMVMRCVTPSPASRSKPLPYPIYRTLEDTVNIMHFRDVPEDGEEKEEEEGEEPEAETAPNS